MQLPGSSNVAPTAARVDRLRRERASVLNFVSSGGPRKVVRVQTAADLLDRGQAST